MSHYKRYKPGTVRSQNIDLNEIDFAVDTSLSWDGKFPDPDRGDYLVTVGSIEHEPVSILVSRRYTSAGDLQNAANIALSAFAERNGIPVDDNGMPRLTTLPDGSPELPCWVERVDKVTS